MVGLSKGKMIVCQMCGVETPKRGNGPQKYCPDCSVKKDLERKRLWAKNNPIPKERIREIQAKRREKSSDIGLEISRKEKKSIFWIHDVDDSVDSIVRVSIPFMYGMSKNAAWSSTGKGHIFLRKEHSQLRDALALRIKNASRGITWFEDKVWIDILVQKPNQRGDAVNVVDAVCDAVKMAIGIDDRWFCIKKLDWQVVKDDPRLIVGVGQKSEGHKRVCSRCGRILPLSMYRKNKHDRLGVGRECKDCLKVGSRKLEIAKKEEGWEEITIRGAGIDEED